MKKTFFSLIAIFQVLMLNGFCINSKFIIEKLHSVYDNVTTFKCNFTQYSFYKSANLLEEYHGTLYLKRPSFMRWDYTLPEVQSIISNGKKIWYYYPKENQVNVGRLTKNSNEMDLIFIICN